ncbi:MAG: hypothetical protein WDM77_10715 [Steroidobacteraceae bacterium]
MARDHPFQPGGALEFYDFVAFSTFAQYISGAFFPSSDPTTGLLKPLPPSRWVMSCDPWRRGLQSFRGQARPPAGVHYRHAAHVLRHGGHRGTAGLPVLGRRGPHRSGAAAGAAGILFGRRIAGSHHTYVVETAPRRAGFVAGFVFFCVNTGVAIAAILNLTLQKTLGSAGIAAGGWRIAFIAGGVLGLVSFWMRLSLSETTEFKKLKHLASKRPFAELIP